MTHDVLMVGVIGLLYLTAVVGEAIVDAVYAWVSWKTGKSQ